MVGHEEGHTGQPSLFITETTNVRNGFIIIKDDHCKLFLQILPQESGAKYLPEGKSAKK